MIILKNFEEFLEEGVVKKQPIDKPRANFLFSQSFKCYNSLMKFVKHFGIHEEDADHIVKNAYDVFMELIRSKMLFDGFNASGNYVHEAEVSYLRKLGFVEYDVQFANQLRYVRNGITYYGKTCGLEYAKKVLNFLNNVYPKLMNLIKK